MNDLQVETSFKQMQTLSEAFAKSGLFGVKTPEQALALMAIAQAEGYSPALAARDYNIIQGKPSLKADAMLARFQQAGGKVEWHDYTDQKVSATFSHPQGGSVTVDWDMERAKKAELLKNPVWGKYPRNMLRARVISEAVRTVYPGVGAVGMYTPEELQDMQYEEAPRQPWKRTQIVEKKLNEKADEEQLKKLIRDQAEDQGIDLISQKQKLLRIFETLKSEPQETLLLRVIEEFHRAFTSPYSATAHAKEEVFRIFPQDEPLAVEAQNEK